MNLGEKQRLFAQMVARLLDKAHELGFAVTLGDAYRDPRVFGQVGEPLGYGHRKSAHKQRLAIDLNLFKDIDDDGILDYLAETERHKPLGDWWEQQHPDCRWGGRFNDGNHYSMEHEGVM